MEWTGKWRKRFYFSSAVRLDMPTTQCCRMPTHTPYITFNLRQAPFGFIHIRFVFLVLSGFFIFNCRTSHRNSGTYIRLCYIDIWTSMGYIQCKPALCLASSMNQKGMQEARSKEILGFVLGCLVSDGTRSSRQERTMREERYLSIFFPATKQQREENFESYWQFTDIPIPQINVGFASLLNTLKRRLIPRREIPRTLSKICSSVC